MIFKDKTKDKIVGGTVPSMTVPISFSEVCSFCEGHLEEGMNVLRYDTTGNVICKYCAREISSLSKELK